MVAQPGSQPQNNNPPGQLRFVLYDQSSASGSSLSRQVRSHAARSGWSVRKQKWKVSKSPSNGTPDSGPSTSNKSQSRLEAGKQNDRSGSGAGSKPTRSTSKGSKKAATNNTTVAQPRSRSRSPSFLETVLQEDYPLWEALGNTSDPFSVYPVVWNPVYAPLLQFWDHSITPGWLNEVNPGWDATQVAAFGHVPLQISVMTSQASAFYGVVALSAACLVPSHPLSPNNTPRLTATLIMKAEQETNAALDDPRMATSNPTIIAVVALACIALYRGNMDQIRNTYLPALKRIFELRGGLQGIIADSGTDSLFPLWLAWGDSVLTANAGRPPLFPDFSDRTRYMTDWENICAKVKHRYTPAWELEEDDVAPQPARIAPD